MSPRLTKKPVFTQSKPVGGIEDQKPGKPDENNDQRSRSMKFIFFFFNGEIKSKIACSSISQLTSTSDTDREAVFLAMFVV